MAASSKPGGVTWTNDEGKYEFTNVMAGRHLLRAAKAGYLTFQYGQRRPSDPGTELEVPPTGVLDSIDFRLPKAGAMTVHVVDEAGEPVAEADVQVFRATVDAKGRRLISFISAMPVGLTNDVGDVRVHSLPADTYFVRASSRRAAAGRPGERRAYVQTYYPGVTQDTQAEPVVVALGQEVSLNLTLMVGTGASGTGLATISGVLLGSDGRPIETKNLVILFERQLPDGRIGEVMGFIPTDAAGRFRKENLQPNSYTLMLVPGPALVPNAPAENPEQVILPISVDGQDINGLVLNATRSGTVRGWIQFDERAPRDALPGTVQLRAVGNVAVVRSTLRNPRSIHVGAVWGSGVMTLKEDWAFELRDIGGGERLIRPYPDHIAGWSLKGVYLNGRDVTDVPFDLDSSKDINDVQVVMTRKQTTIDGTVTGEDGQPATHYTAVAFSEQSDRWRVFSRSIAVAQSDQNGTFKILGLPVGSYFVAATESLEPGSEYEHDVLNRLKDTAVSITIREGESQTIKLRLIDK
jgi:protocatechuate 3,4-dioxygenase beta subunit